MDLVWATYELGVARLSLPRGSVAKLLPNSNRMAERPDLHGAETADRVAFAIPRAAARVPWRADCLVQAIAARRWLKRKGVDSTIQLGVRNSPGQRLDAHAWLTCGGKVVTGGDVSAFVPLSRPEVLDALREGSTVRR